MSKGYKIKRRKKSGAGSFFVVLIAFILIIAIAFAVAYIWQKSEGTSNSSSSSSSSSLSSQTSSSSTSSISSSTTSNTSSTSHTTEDYAVFNNALFIGDSITYGIQSYGVLNNADVLASTGINLDNISTQQTIKVNGQYVTLTEALQYFNPKNVFIMLGSNGIEFINLETHIQLYSNFLDTVKAAYPNARIFVQSVLPVTKKFEEERPNLTNAIINQFNDRLKILAEEKNCIYLDVNAVLCDSSGALPNEASPVDGMHFGPTYYYKWFDYLVDELEKYDN